MKRLFIILLLACASVVAFAQNPLLRQRMELAEIETEEDNIHLQVFYMDDESPRVYYLSLGDLGIGVEIVQVHFDPIYELFIPLGNTLDDAIDKLKEIQDYYKQPRLWSTQITGCFSVAYPSNDPITVTVTSRRLLTTRILEFSIPADDLDRATHISRMDFTSLLNAVKLYRKIHPNEK